MSFAPTLALLPSRSARPARGPGFLGRTPPLQLYSFGGAEDTLASMTRMVHGERGEKSPKVRSFTEWVVRDVWPKDYFGEILAVRNVFLQPSPWRAGTPLLRYTNDPRHVEWVKSPQTIVEEIDAHGSALIDCDEATHLAATMLLQLGREVEYVALGFGPDLTHVGLRVREPKSGRFIWIDSVAGPREREAAETATKRKFWSLD